MRQFAPARPSPGGAGIGYAIDLQPAASVWQQLNEWNCSCGNALAKDWPRTKKPKTEAVGRWQMADEAASSWSRSVSGKPKTQAVGSWQIKQRAPAWQRPSKLRKVKE
jgi:hypothetical protein